MSSARSAASQRSSCIGVVGGERLDLAVARSRARGVLRSPQRIRWRSLGRASRSNSASQVSTLISPFEGAGGTWALWISTGPAGDSLTRREHALRLRRADRRQLGQLPAARGQVEEPPPAGEGGRVERVVEAGRGQRLRPGPTVLGRISCRQTRSASRRATAAICSASSSSAPGDVPAQQGERHARSVQSACG